MTYLVISSIFCAGGAIVVYWLHSQSQMDIVVAPALPPTLAPLISICIPARNEEQNIRACVEAALTQDYPNFEVIVLDDRSTDATPRILADLAARDSRLRLISGSELPPGWIGKPHALRQASAAARGAWLCFIDADTFLAPQALSSCYVKALEVQADLFTTLHRQIMASFWEKTVLPIVVTALSVGFSPRKVNDPAHKDAVASGQFILIRREIYKKIGGHASVWDQIVEDQAIAERVIMERIPTRARRWVGAHQHADVYVLKFHVGRLDQEHVSWASQPTQFAMAGNRRSVAGVDGGVIFANMAGLRVMVGAQQRRHYRTDRPCRSADRLVRRVNRTRTNGATHGHLSALFAFHAAWRGRFRRHDDRFCMAVAFKPRSPVARKTICSTKII